MAESKPLKVPRWNDDLTNQTEPPELYKDTGWLVDDHPDGSFWNWLLFYTGAWLKWFNERHFDGVDEEDYTIYPPESAGSLGGTMKISGGIGAASSTGGDLEVSGGQGGVSAGGGGDTTLRGGDAIASGSSGGQCLVRGGNSASNGNGGALFMKGGTTFGAGDGGPATLVGGDSSGTDRDGGDTSIKGGNATGDGHSNVVISAVDGDQGPGTSIRSPASYIRADGITRQISTLRPLVPGNSLDSGSRAPFRLSPLSGDPGAPTLPVSATGEMWNIVDSGQPAYRNKVTAFDQNFAPLVHRQLNADSQILSAGVETTFTYLASVIQYTIPADTLRQGSLLRWRAAALVTGASGQFIVKYYIGDPVTVPTTEPYTGFSLLGGIGYNPTPTQTSREVNLISDWIVTNIGVSGTTRGAGIITGTSPGAASDTVHAQTNIGSLIGIDTTADLHVFLTAEATVAGTVSLVYWTLEVI